MNQDPNELRVAPPGRRFSLSYRAELIFGVASLVLLTGAVVLWLAQRSATAGVAMLTESLFREVSMHAVTQTRSFVLGAIPVIEPLHNLAETAQSPEDADHQIARRLLALLEANPVFGGASYANVAGMYVAMHRADSGTYRGEEGKFAKGRMQKQQIEPQADGAWKTVGTDASSAFDPRMQPSFAKAEQSMRLVWLPAFLSVNQETPTVACAMPTFDQSARFRGVLNVDIDLRELSTFVRNLKFSDHSKVFIFTADQRLLAYPDTRPPAAEGWRTPDGLPNLSHTGDSLIATYRTRLDGDFLNATTAGNFHLFEFRYDGKDYLASTTAFKIGTDLDWVVGAVAPKADLLSGVWNSQALAAAAAVAAVLLAVGVAVFLARQVSKPVLSLIGFMERVGDGDLQTQVKLGGNREFQQLSQALNRMIGDLRDRLRLRHSLNLAMEVQQSLLPSHPPTVRGLDIAGHSSYCDETGGDYYDFLALDRPEPDGLLTVMGDVVGHGIAAALVMAGARAILHSRSGSFSSLAEMMGELNRLLTPDLGGTRFMTMHLSVVNSQKKFIHWASAGHDPAMLFDPANGKFIELGGSDLPLGLRADATYHEMTYEGLKPGQILMVGTDGVWELPNAQGEQFGKQRLQEVIQASASRPAREIVETILNAMTSFRGNFRQVDDITLVIVKILAPEENT